MERHMQDVTNIIEFFIYALASIFVIVNPIGATMVFIPLTSGATSEEKTRICFRATSTAYVIALVFALTGDLVLRFFGASVDSLRVAGGILLFIMAMEMLRAKQRIKVTEAEMVDASERDDVSVFPLAMPLLTGPGTITTVIVYMGAAAGFVEKGAVVLATTATFLLAYGTLRISEEIGNFLGVTGILVMTRIMGLILGAIAVNFVAIGTWNIYLGLAHGT